jgi:hypothetical protein
MSDDTNTVLTSVAVMDGIEAYRQLRLDEQASAETWLIVGRALSLIAASCGEQVTDGVITTLANPKLMGKLVAAAGCFADMPSDVRSNAKWMFHAQEELRRLSNQGITLGHPNATRSAYRAICKKLEAAEKAEGKTPEQIKEEKALEKAAKEAAKGAAHRRLTDTEWKAFVGVMTKAPEEFRFLFDILTEKAEQIPELLTGWAKKVAEQIEEDEKSAKIGAVVPGKRPSKKKSAAELHEAIAA